MDIVDPEQAHWKSKCLTLIFLALLISLIFFFDFLKRITVASIESSPQPTTSKYLDTANEDTRKLEDTDDEEFDENQFLNRGNKS